MSTLKGLISGLAVAAAGAVAAPGAWALPIGPLSDSFGYSGNDIAFNLRDISGTGTPLTTGDDVVTPVALGFTFNFYGVDYTTATISSNGFLSFNAGVSSGCCTGQVLPATSDPDNVVAGFWEDLHPPSGGTYRYETLGVAGSRTFVVGFYNILHFFSAPPAVTFEMILHEGSNNIEFQYASAATDGGIHSAGIENADGTIGIQMGLGGGLNFSQQGYLITLSDAQTAVPEPATLLLFGTGLAAAGVRRYRQRKTDRIRQP